MQMRDAVASRGSRWGEAIVAMTAFGACFCVIAASGVETVG
jgi:hypothetical protein